MPSLFFSRPCLNHSLLHFSDAIRFYAPAFPTRFHAVPCFCYAILITTNPKPDNTLLFRRTAVPAQFYALHHFASPVQCVALQGKSAADRSQAILNSSLPSLLNALPMPRLTNLTPCKTDLSSTSLFQCKSVRVHSCAILVSAGANHCHSIALPLLCSSMPRLRPS